MMKNSDRLLSNRIKIITFASVIACAQAAHSEIVTITFDEPGVALGDEITTQYADVGATFSGTLSLVKLPGPRPPGQPATKYLNNPFDSDGQLLHFDLSPVLAFVDLDSPADFLSFDFRRPFDDGEIFLRLFSGDDPVHDFGLIGWDPSVTPDWVTFEYFGVFGSYDRIEFSGGSKYVIDNLAFGAQVVPLPAPLLLLSVAVGGLLGLPWKRRLSQAVNCTR